VLDLVIKKLKEWRVEDDIVEGIEELRQQAGEQG
jgi:hypothetical protein